MKKRKNLYVFIVLFLVSFILITICSRSSFLYPMNNWDDANCYLSVAKGMLNGRVLYRDVFDHKGPYMYALYMLGYFISNDSFIGVYIIEVCLSAFFLYGTCKIMCLYCNKRTALLITPILGASVYSTMSFYWGGSAEEMFLPCLIFPLLIVLSHMENRKGTLEIWKLFALGLFTGIWALVKFNLLGFFFGLMLMLLFDYIKNKERIIKPLLCYISGIIVAFLPWIIYFGINGAIDDFIDNYIYLNAFYGNMSGDSLSVYDRFYWIAKYLLWDMLEDTSYFIWIVIGCLFTLLGPKRSILNRITCSITFILTATGIYIGGSTLKYYALPLCVFAPVGFGAGGALIDKVMGVVNIKKDKIKNYIFSLAIVLIIIVSSFYSYNVSNNVYFMSVVKEDLYLYKFKEIINKTSNPTLLNINCLDVGLFTVCNIVPSCKWFQEVNVNIEEMYEQQEASVRKGETDFVVSRYDYPEYIFDKYELVEEEEVSYPDLQCTYYLFRKK